MTARKLRDISCQSMGVCQKRFCAEITCLDERSGRTRKSAFRGRENKAHMTLSRVINIADLRQLARSRLPKVVFDYLDGGAEDEITQRSNCLKFQEVTLKPRQAIS